MIDDIEDAVRHRQYFKRTRSEWLAETELVEKGPPDPAAFPKDRILILVEPVAAAPPRREASR